MQKRGGLTGPVHAMLAGEHLKMLADDCLVLAGRTGRSSWGAWRAWLAIDPPHWASTFPGR